MLVACLIVGGCGGTPRVRKELANVASSVDCHVGHQGCPSAPPAYRSEADPNVDDDSDWAGVPGRGFDDPRLSSGPWLRASPASADCFLDDFAPSHLPVSQVVFSSATKMATMSTSGGTASIGWSASRKETSLVLAYRGEDPPAGADWGGADVYSIGGQPLVLTIGACTYHPSAQVPAAD